VFDKARFACALVDLGLPDGDGRELIERFRKKDPCVVQIVLTGDSSARTIIDAMRAGAFDYLTKPVNMTTLKAAISRAVAHHSVILEREELFRLLYEEREQLRARVEAATADIREYAAACEGSNARLRALLRLAQVSSSHYSEEALMRCVFDEVRKHVPLRSVVLFDSSTRKLAAVCADDEGEPGDDQHGHFLGGSGTLDPVDYDPLLAEVEPELMLRQWVERHAAMDTSNLVAMVYPQEFWNRRTCTVGFLLAAVFHENASDREFLDMCAHLLAFEWERGKLLFHVAHQASLGNIATELVRGFIQPLTAIRTAADFLDETVKAPETPEGVRVIQDNVERLRHQTQEFRKLSLMRENSVETVRLEDYVNHAVDMLSVAIQNRNVSVDKDIRGDCECVLLNGTALARTFLDLILGALRAVDVGGRVWVSLYLADDDHVAFEIRHDGPQKGMFVDSNSSVLASTSGTGRANLGLQLAERAVHSCGGTLSVEFDEEERGALRILLPRNATRPGPPPGAVP